MATAPTAVVGVAVPVGPSRYSAVAHGAPEAPATTVIPVSLPQSLLLDPTAPMETRHDRSGSPIHRYAVREGAETLSAPRVRKSRSPLSSYVSAPIVHESHGSPFLESRASSANSQQSRYSSPMNFRERRNRDSRNASQDHLGQTVYVRQGVPLHPGGSSAETVVIARAQSPVPSNTASAVENGCQDDLSRTSSVKSASLKQQSSTSLQMELKEIRTRLEKQHAHHQQLIGMKPAGLATESMPPSSSPPANTPPTSTPALCITPAVSAVQPTRQVGSVDLEMEVRDLRSSIANQNAEQERFFQILRRDMDMLQKQMQALREQDPTSALVPGLQEMDVRMHELRVEVNQKVSRQEARVDSWAAEIMKKQKADAERADNSTLAQDVQQLAQCVTDLRTHHNSLIMEIESEVTNLRLVLRELRAADASDERLANLHKALEDHRQEGWGTWKELQANLHKALEDHRQEGWGTLKELQADIERLRRQQEEDSVEALNKSNMVLLQAQKDMTSLRELLDQGLTQQGSKFQEEAIETIRDLRAEVDLLGRRHDDFGAELAKKDGQIALQVEAHFGEIQQSLQQQASLQAEVELLQRKQDSHFGEVQQSLQQQTNLQAEVEFLQRKHESHIGEVQHSLQQQANLQAELEFLRRRHEDVGADLATKDSQISVQTKALGEMQKSGQQQQASLLAEVDFLRRRHEELRADLANKDADIASQIKAHVGNLQSSLQEQQALEDSKRKEEVVEMIRHFQAESTYLRKKHEEIGQDLSNRESPMPMVRELQAEFEKLWLSFQQQQAHQDQTALAQQVAKEAQRLEVESVQQHLQKQRAQLDALHAASKASAEVRDAEAKAVRTQMNQQAEAFKKLHTQVLNLGDFTKRGISSMPDLPPTQPVGDSMEISALKSELDALKQNAGTQQSLQAAEMAKDAYTLHGQLQKVIGTERDARIQESIEVRALIRHLYEELSQLSAGIQAPPRSSGSLSYPASEKAVSNSGSGNFGSGNFGLGEPLDIRHVEVTRFIGRAQPD